jgi:predicted nucleic acid-binding protein
MAPKLYLDTNILFDFFFDREPFSESAAQLFELCGEGKIAFYLSSLSIANLAYHSQRVKKNPVPIIEVLLKIATVVNLQKNHFVSVNHSKFADYEDGLQYFSALEIRNIEAIITRDKKDFKLSSIPVFTPAEFIDYFAQ